MRFCHPYFILLGAKHFLMTIMPLWQANCPKSNFPMGIVNEKLWNSDMDSRVANRITSNSQMHGRSKLWCSSVQFDLSQMT